MVQRVSIVANATDGWNIGSVVTLVSDSRNTQMLTKDFDVNRWIDGGGDTPHKRFVLILSPSEVNAGEYIYIYLASACCMYIRMCALIC